MPSPSDENYNRSARDFDTMRVVEGPLIPGQSDIIRELRARIREDLPLPAVVNKRQIEFQSLPVTVESGVDQVIQPFTFQAGVKGQYTARTREIRLPGLSTVPADLEPI